MGCEVLYVSSTGMEIADEVVDQICEASGLINRGPKKRTDLAFLNNTEEPAILIETCFVDSQGRRGHLLSELRRDLRRHCRRDCRARIAATRSRTPEPPERCAVRSGRNVLHLRRSRRYRRERLAKAWPCGTNREECPWLMLEKQPPGTTGMARRLDPTVFYLACRWDYDVDVQGTARGPADGAGHQQGDRR